MDALRIVVAAGALATACLLAACGGGGDQPVVVTPDTPPVSTPSALDNFLLFPNPQQESLTNKTQQTNTLEYAQAYYAAIDPSNERDTLAKWKAKNGFGSGTGTEVTVAFGDRRDLGYGRRMTARMIDSKHIAFIVENYLVSPGGAYGTNSPISLEAAVREDHRWRLLINAIEFSPQEGNPDGASFAKFFNFDPVTGERELSVDLDLRGQKAMPGPCVTCHGGRGDRLVPDPVTSKLVFQLVQNTTPNARGDVQARLAPLEVDTFDFSPIPGYTKAEQEAKLKLMNQMVLCSYPLPDPLPAGASPGVPASFCTREKANKSEWQGTAADLLIQAYGGDGLSPVYSTPPVPDAWKGNAPLYQNVVAPSCRMCHILRGSGGQSDIDFTTLDKFAGYAVFPFLPGGMQYPRREGADDRLKVHTIDRGDMPLAKLVFDNFWSSTNPETLASFLESKQFKVRDAAGKVLEPGRPIADPGPDRVIRLGETKLTAEASLYANAFTWSVASAPAGRQPTFSNPNSATPTFTTFVTGDYTLRLIARNGSLQSEPAILTLFVPLDPPEPVFFDDVAKVLDLSCTGSGCHTAPDPPDPTSVGPPVFFRAADGPRMDRKAFRAEVLSRINFTDIVASPLLRKPSGLHHNRVGVVGRFDTAQAPGHALRRDYDLVVNWILADAPLDPP